MREEITKPIKVICVDSKTSIKLIKDAIYSATSLYTWGSKNRYI